LKFDESFINVDLPLPLSMEELYCYFEKMKLGDQNARDVIICHNIRLVIDEVAKKFSNTSYDLKELVSVGLIGLIKSVDTFDISKGFYFSTYAVRCIDNEILIEQGSVTVVEIENKSYFYNVISELYSFMNGEVVDTIKFFDNSSKEIMMTGKIEILLNFFNLQFDSKKYISELTKRISNEVTEEQRDEIIKIFKRLQSIYKKMLNNIDLPLSINSDINIDSISKILKIEIKTKNSLLENLLTIIDLERELKLHKLLYFVNLKQYLHIDELKELYKYAIYNQINIVLIDSQSYGTTLEYERKLIIDNNLDEFMLEYK